MTKPSLSSLRAAILKLLRYDWATDEPFMEASPVGDWLRRSEVLALIPEEEAEPDNHHNAVTCPYCNPDGLVLVPRDICRAIRQWSEETTRRLAVEIAVRSQQHLPFWERALRQLKDAPIPAHGSAADPPEAGRNEVDRGE